MRHTGVLARAAAGILLAAAMLSGCGGGSEPDSSPKKDSPPTDEEWTTAYETYVEVGDAFNAAISGATDYQSAVRKVHDTSPAAVLTDPAVAAALADQQELAATRDEEIAALGEVPAMSDPELQEAYDAFASAAEEMNTFQDGYNESMPVLLRSLDVCPDIFSIKAPTGALTVILGTYADVWIKRHNQAAKPCLALLDELDDSRNYRVRQYAANFRKVIEQRNDLMADLGAGEIGFEQMPGRLERINDAFTKRNEKLTRFTAALAKVSAVEEYQALDAIFVENGATPQSPSPSPSPSSS
jgi:hypothetical protein